MLLGKVVCPHCQTILRSNGPPPRGKKIKCRNCGAPFLVTDESVRRAEALDAAAAPSRPAAVPSIPVVVPTAPAAADARPASPKTDHAPWSYSHPGQPPSGPCTWEELLQLVAAGKLQSQDLVRREGLA